MNRRLEVDPSYPLAFLGEIIEAAFNGTLGTRLELVVEHKWARLGPGRQVAGMKQVTIPGPTIWDRTLYKGTLAGETVAPFVAFMKREADLIGKKVIFMGIPVGGVDLLDNHYIQVRRAKVFFPTREWLESYSGSESCLEGAKV